MSKMWFGVVSPLAFAMSAVAFASGCTGSLGAGAEANSVDAIDSGTSEPVATTTDAGAHDSAVVTNVGIDANTPRGASTAIDAASSAAPALGKVPDAIITRAIADTLILYGKSLPGGAYTNMGDSGGGSIMLAIASYEGDTRTDARLLEQMRYTLQGSNAICATGGYPAQHELFVTGMYAIAKQTPRIWSQLSATEVSAVDAVMEASLIGSAFTTSDANPFVVANTQQYTLDGDANIDRGWNPNYLDGMIGSVATAAAYFGVNNAISILASYDHAAFVAKLQSAGLTNTHQTFNWKIANPSSGAPTGSQIETAVHRYAYHGHDLTNLMDYDQFITDYAYSSTIECGLNNGAGVKLASGSYSGVIVSDCAGLPNVGSKGMILEFNSYDAEGQRSNTDYAYCAYKGNLIPHVAMVIAGVWQSGANATAIASELKVGSQDLWFKLDNGYHDYAHAKDDGVNTFTTAGYGFAYMRSAWEDVLLPAFAGVS
jgi:hypothetical protein